MKEKYLSYKYLILIIFLFTCLFIFSTTSLALIPGDFGSTGGGPPDGVVDFEDLMIFAMAYGSTPPDANWNPVCDIAGPGGPAPDGVIDFEDLMIFAMHYRETYAITEVKAIAITTPHSLGPVTPPVPASSMIGLEDRTNKIGEKSLILQNIKFDKLKGKEGDSYYAVLIYWNVILEENFNEDINFKVYRSIDGINYDNIVSNDYFYLDELYFDGEEYIIGGIDIDVDPNAGNTYSYYVTAYGSDWETNPSQIVSIDSWLPSCCSPNSPQDGSLITEPNPAFTWDPVGVSNFPYGSICSGESDIWVGDSTEFAQAWWITFHDLTTSTATYNQDGQGTPLTPGHGYYWDSYSYGYNLDGDLIALSICEARSFNYKITEGVVSNVKAIAVTSRLGYEDYYVEIYYSSYPEASNYKIYRSVNGGNYELLPDCLSREFPPDNNWHYLGGGVVWPSPPPFWDDDVSPENTYSYYVIACGDGWETAPSEIVTIDTWLPFCVLTSPPNNSAITEPNPIFTWNPGVTSLPYGSICSGRSHLFVWGGDVEGWYPNFDDLTTSLATYNQDGQATPLEVGNRYGWQIYLHGYDENGNTIAISESINWNFQYGAIVTDIEARAITRQGTSMEMFQAKMEQLVEDELIPDSYYLNELSPLTKGITEHIIDVDWHSYPDATGYKVYRSVNGGSYSVVFQDESITGYDWYGFWDDDVSEGNTYTYYVTAYGSSWETDPSPEVTIDTFLPPCSLISPTDESIITDSTPTFTWNPVGVSSFPYGSIYSGYSNFNVWSSYVGGWYFYFDDLTTSSATYNQDGQAAPLEVGNSYSWQINSYGYSENGKLIAFSWSEYWNFQYGAIVTDIEARAITRQGTSMEMFQAKMEQLVEDELIPDSYHLNELLPPTKGVTEYEIDVNWHSYPDATGYKVYRSVNGGSYSVIFQDEPTTGDDWYGFWDDDVSEGSSYTYYVTAYSSGWETDPSSEVTIDTFLPPCSLISPTDESIITDSNPIFTWNPVGVSSFPYGSIYSGNSSLDVWSEYVGGWYFYFDDLTTSSATYNQDGQAAPLEVGNNYSWCINSLGYSENNKLIACSWSEYWGFTYTGN